MDREEVVDALNASGNADMECLCVSLCLCSMCLCASLCLCSMCLCASLTFNFFLSELIIKS